MGMLKHNDSEGDLILQGCMLHNWLARDLHKTNGQMIVPWVRIFLGKVFKSVNLNTLIVHVYATRKLVYL